MQEYFILNENKKKMLDKYKLIYKSEKSICIKYIILYTLIKIYKLDWLRKYKNTFNLFDSELVGIKYPMLFGS